MKASILMVIFTIGFVAPVHSAGVNLEAASKGRNIIISKFGDQYSSVTDFNRFGKELASEYFGVDFVDGSSFQAAFQNLIFNFDSVLSSEDFPFKASADEIKTRATQVYEQEFNSLKRGEFDGFIIKITALHRKLFTFLMAQNIKNVNYVGKLVWNAGVYIDLQKRFLASFENQKEGRELTAKFESKIQDLLAATEKDSVVYNSYEHLIKNTLDDLRRELDFVVYSVIQEAYNLDESQPELYLEKVLGLTQIISLLSKNQGEVVYLEMGRVLVNKRVAIYISKKLSDDLNEWILSVLNGYIIALKNQLKPLAALNILQSLLSKELPTMINRSDLGNSLAQIAKEDSIFDLNESNKDFKILLLASLVVSGNADFFNEETIAKTLDSFFEIMSFSFDQFISYRLVSPILLNRIVSEEISTRFVRSALWRISKAIQSSEDFDAQTSLFEILDATIDLQKGTLNDDEFYVPLKLANAILAKIYRAHFAMNFDQDENTAKIFKLALGTEEFEKLDSIVKHLWARELEYSVSKSDVETKSYADWLLEQELSSMSFNDIVDISATSDKFVFKFDLVDFRLEFPQANVVIEEKDIAVEEIADLEKLDEQNNLNKKGNTGAENNVSHIEEPNLLEIPEILEDQENYASILEDDHKQEEILNSVPQIIEMEENDKPRTNSATVLKGRLTQKAMEFITNADNLAENLKTSNTFVDDDGAQFEVTYLQVVPHKSKCHDSIIKFLSEL